MLPNRRNFLKYGVLTAIAGLIPSPVKGALNEYWLDERCLWFYNTHTGEELNVLYYSYGQYKPEALKLVNYILRDHRTGEIKPINPCLLNLLFVISKKTGVKSPFNIISGYRSPSTNAWLCKRSNEVSIKSLHMYGKAIDIRLPGIKLDSLHLTARKLRAGGVGYYPNSNFIHVDVGPVHYW